MNDNVRDVVIVGGGQAGLAVGYFLRRSGLSFSILDAGPGPGGAWRHAWPSLRLFSPAQWSSLPGWQMPSDGDAFPGRNAVMAYFAEYENRYDLPIERSIEVNAVSLLKDQFLLATNRGDWTASAVVSATGTWRRPFIPEYPGCDIFEGRQLHSARYTGAGDFARNSVLIVGGGNSGAQIQSEVSEVADTIWVTQRDPVFLPDDVDGRVLFERATARWKAGGDFSVRKVPAGGLGDIVMIPSVRDARTRGALNSVRPFASFTRTGVVWGDGTETPLDAVIWCTGFTPALDHLSPLDLVGDDGKVDVAGTRSVGVPRLWLVGYGEWTGFASATIVGVMRSARQTASEIEQLFRAADTA